jgi:uncharacterized phiE125 gp8 family phage protein
VALVFDNVVYGGLYLASNRQPFNWYSLQELERNLTTEWLDLETIRAHLNLYSDTSQDALLEQYELATRQYIEDYLGKSIFSKSYQTNYGLGVFQDPVTALDIPNAYSNVTINLVNYWDENGVNQMVPMGKFTFDDIGAKVIIQSFGTSVDPNRTAPISVQFTVDSNPIATYATVKQAGLLLLAHFYNNRSMTSEKAQTQLPFAFDTLLRPYREIVM